MEGDAEARRGLPAMTHPTDQERAREVAETIARKHYGLPNESWGIGEGSKADKLATTIADALLSFAPQPSPSDEVRGLIEAAEIASSQLRDFAKIEGATGDKEGQHETVMLASLLEKMAAALSTPPSSPVSGEGEREAHMDAYQYGGDKPSRPPEPAARGEGGTK